MVAKNEWVAKKMFCGCKLVAKKALVVKMVAKLQKLGPDGPDG